LKLVNKLGVRDYLVGHEMTAADLTLAALLRPLRTSYFFKSHPGLTSLFRHQDRIFTRFSRPPYLYELDREAAQAVNVRRTMQVSALPMDGNFSFDAQEAENDQLPVYHWKFLFSPIHYF